MSIQQLQQILGLHGQIGAAQTLGISLMQPANTNNSQNQQAIPQPLIFNTLHNTSGTNLQSHSLNHVPTIPGINHAMPSNQMSTFNNNSNLIGPPSSANFLPPNGMPNISSGNMNICQGPNGVLTYNGVNYVRQDQAPALQPIIIVMGGSAAQPLPTAPTDQQIQPANDDCGPDNTTDEHLDEQGGSAVDEQEDSYEKYADNSTDESHEDERRQILFDPGMAEPGKT